MSHCLTSARIGVPDLCGVCWVLSFTLLFPSAGWARAADTGQASCPSSRWCCGEAGWCERQSGACHSSTAGGSMSRMALPGWCAQRAYAQSCKLCAPPLPTCRGYEASPFVKVVRELLCELEIPHVMRSCARGSPKRQELWEQRGHFQVRGSSAGGWRGLWCGPLGSSALSLSRERTATAIGLQTWRRKSRLLLLLCAAPVPCLKVPRWHGFRHHGRCSLTPAGPSCAAAGAVP